MTEDHRRTRESGSERRVDAPEALFDDEISLTPLLRTLWLYRRFIAASISGIVIAYTFGALYAFLVQPSERRASVEFRLLFEGAGEGRYPNGLAFGPGEIISTPVLSRVYEMNDLDRYLPYDEFRDGIFVLESNPELELLNLEYRERLSESGLNPGDRATLEEEFRQRREALRVPQYTLNFMSPGDTSSIPSSVMEKAINDVLAVWAADAAERKGALNYQTGVLSSNVLLGEIADAEDYSVRVDVLRDKVRSVIRNIDELLALPGAYLVRVGENGISLPEIRNNLEEIRRFSLEPLFDIAALTSIAQDPAPLTIYMERRLRQLRLDQQEAEARIATFRDALRTYTSEQASMSSPSGQAGDAGGLLAGSTPVMPQIGESFLDRLVELSVESGDSQYRQQLTDNIIESGLLAVSLERERSYYEDIATSVISSGGSVTPETLDHIRSRYDQAYAAVSRAIEHIGAAYQELSARNLNPRTNLYALSGPFSIGTERALGVRTLALYGVLTLMLTLLLAPLGCILHHYFRSEILARVGTRASDGEETPARNGGGVAR